MQSQTTEAKEAMIQYKQARDVPIRRLLQGRRRRGAAGGIQRVELGEYVAERPALVGVEGPGAPQLHALEAPAGGGKKQRGGGRSVATNTNRTELRNGGGGITLRPSSPSPPPGRQRRGPRCGSALRRPPGVYRVLTAPRVKSTLRRRPEPKQQERISNIVNEKESEMNSSSRRGSAWWKAQTARATRSEVAFDWEEPRSWAAASGERRRLTRTEWWPPVETGD
jgi:hypothetical protein